MKNWSCFTRREVIFFFCYLFLYRLLYVHVSRILLNNMCMLLCIGMVTLTRLSPDKAVRQFAIIVVSAGLTWLIPLCDRSGVAAWQDHMALCSSGDCFSAYGAADRE